MPDNTVTAIYGQGNARGIACFGLPGWWYQAPCTTFRFRSPRHLLEGLEGRERMRGWDGTEQEHRDEMTVRLEGWDAAFLAQPRQAVQATGPRGADRRKARPVSVDRPRTLRPT